MCLVKRQRQTKSNPHSRKQSPHECNLTKQMQESVLLLSKRMEQPTEFQATNYTQMGDYRLGRHLGAGSYASVKQAVHRASGLQTAIKIYDKMKALGEMHRRNIKREIALLRKLKHPTLIQLHDVIESSTSLYLVMELASGRNLN